MRTIKNAFILSLTLIVFVGTAAFAYNADDKTTEKTREAVENAGPDDWYTLAVSAEKCFKKNVNMKEAAEWLDQSIEIARTPYNLELKGDYYMINQLPEKALESYVEAMNALKSKDFQADVSDLQQKISKITNIGG